MPGTEVVPNAPSSTAASVGGRRRSGTSVKTLKKVLKKAGLKVSGKKSTLTRRAKKARLMGGAEEEIVEEVDGGRRRRKSRGGNYKLY